MHNTASKLAPWYDCASLQSAFGRSTPLSPVGTVSPLSNSISLPTASLQEQAASETSAPHLHRCPPPSSLPHAHLSGHSPKWRQNPHHSACVLCMCTHTFEIHRICYLEVCVKPALSPKWRCPSFSNYSGLFDWGENRTIFSIQFVTFCLSVCVCLFVCTLAASHPDFYSSACVFSSFTWYVPVAAAQQHICNPNDLLKYTSEMVKHFLCHAICVTKIRLLSTNRNRQDTQRTIKVISR